MDFWTQTHLIDKRISLTFRVVFALENLFIANF